ncbi:MAG TPA: YetF domain-containing protein [Anaerolineales bacterium]|nr:YetF domain-containing protein [Anaerolineales bacterium]
MEELDLTGIVLRVSVMYLFALALVRIAGKQAIGQLTGMDFVVTLIVGDLFDDIFWATVPLAQGMVAFAIVVFSHILVTFLSSRNLRFYRLATPPARLLIEDGKLMQKSLQQERMRPDHLQADLRIAGEEHPSEIKQAWLEPSGQVSVIKNSDSRPIRKKDKRLFG